MGNSMTINEMIKALEKEGYRCVKGHNVGVFNHGENNVGNANNGNENMASCNNGDRNNGYGNFGDNNNTGEENIGNWNSGNNNSGNWNSGNYNSGNFNSGCWNACDLSSGFFNTKTKIFLFNKPVSDDFSFPAIDCLHFSLTLWVDIENMTEQEKIDHPECYETCGYLQELDYKESFHKSLMEATKEEIEEIMALPNFDADIFNEISGSDILAVYLSK